MMNQFSRRLGELCLGESSHRQFGFLLFLLLALLAPSARAQNILINEIMFHASSENPREEYLELYNAGPTNVNLSGWQFTRGISFTFPTNTFIKASGFLVLAANANSFAIKYPSVTNYLGSFLVVRTTNVASGTYTNYENGLSNTRDRLTLEDAAGNVIDDLTYADEGDWAIRQRGLLDGGYQGWTWLSLADGLGRSLELINPALPNERGQNWASSTTINGTPGVANSVASNNGAPLVTDVAHSPLIPQSTNNVTITARVIDEATVSNVQLFWRVNNGAPPVFTTAAMFDDGAHGDGAAGDGLWGAVIPAQAHLAIVEFYVEAVDGSNQTNSWPRPAVNIDGVTLMNRASFSINALYQVDNTAYTGVAPLYKLILTPAENTELGNMLSGSPNSDASMNCTFISLDGQGTEVRYLCSVRNRGHGSRSGNPHNYRIGMVSDAPWKGMTAINMNARTPHAQHFGSILALKSGAVGANSHAAQLRINGGTGPGGTPANNHYAANEDIGGDWAEVHFPDDSAGNAYKAIRDISPPNFNYRGTTPGSYQNTYFKQSNNSENDWADLITMLEVMGENQTSLFTTERARSVVNVEQWLLHLAVMNLYGNNETGLNTGYNDDYYMYRGVNDPRFVLAYHDLDTILGLSGSLSTSASIFTATTVQGTGGSGTAMNWFMHWPEFEPLYHQTLQRLLDTSFAKTNFDALIDQTLSFYVPSGTINTMKTWMDGRRTFVQGVLNSYFAVNPIPPRATISGEPRSPSPLTSATLTVGGSNVVSYRYKLNNGSYGLETPVATPISLAGLPNGSTNVVYVMGKSAAGAWQHGTNSPTVSKVWVVNTAVPLVRLNEVLAQNVAAVNHAGTFPDVIELYNESASPVNISGLRLTDDPANPNKFAFPPNTSIPGGSYLVVYANNEDGSGGLHTGFSLSATGEGVYLFHATSNTVLDSVVFGVQLTDLSVGRFGLSGEWKLCTPTAGATNTARATGDRNVLRINEWLTAGSPPFAEDFVELYNPSSLPIDFGGCFFTDNAIGEPFKSPVPPLTFIQSNAWLALTADGNTSAGADHLDFSLSSDLGEITLLDPLLAAIDSVSYGPQNINVSQGRCSDGVNKFSFLSVPSPGAPNVCPASGNSGTYSVMPYSQAWRYDQTSNLDGANWMAPNYNDSGWLSGQGVLASAATIAEPVRTFLVMTSGRYTYYFRSTFVISNLASMSSLLLSHYIDDGAVVYLNGQEAYRYNLPSGAVTFTTQAPNLSGPPGELGPFPLPLTNVFVGTNSIAIELHQSSNTTGDLFMGAKLDALTNTAASAGLVINEILANNSNVEEPDGSTPDWIEIYNPSVSAVDLVGARLTDNIAEPGWTFPSGSIVPGKGYYRVFFSSGAPVSATNTGFGLSDAGDSVYLFASGGGLLDSITFGLQAVDFSIGRITPSGTNWTLNIPTPGATNLVQNLGEPALVKINEWMANPTSGDDWFELFNANSIPVAIGDYWLTDDFSTAGTRMRYQIPRLSFIGINAYAYRVFHADDNPQNGANHTNFKLGNSGDSLGFSQPGGTLLDGVTFGVQASGISQGRLPDGGTMVTNFTVSVSQGDLNWLPLNNIVISEVLAHTDPPLEDAIEIQNTNTSSVNITGWFLSDSKNDLRRYPLTNAITLPAGGFRVFYETQFNDTSMPFSAFALSSSKGDEVYLSAATNGVLTGYRAQAKFGASANGVSFGRHRRSDGQDDFTPMSARTFGVDSPATVAEFRSSTGKTNAYPKVGPIVLNEIMYHPPDINALDNTRDEFVELKNITGAAVALYDPAYPSNRWRLRGGVDFDFPANTILAPNATLIVVSFNPSNTTALDEFKNTYGITSAVTILGPWSGQLANSSEEIELLRPDAPQLPPASDAGFVPYLLTERVVYADLPPWPAVADGSGWSLQRVSGSGYGNDPTNWVGAPPSLNIAAGTGDTDGDGMPDAWESQYPLALNPNNPNDAGTDYDGDGMTNLQEYLAGTNPQLASSQLRLTGSFVSASQIRLQFNAVSNVGYNFQSRSSLSTGAWLNLQNVPAAPSNRTVTITNPAAPMRFYRVVIP
jgi:hypothetical protein